MSTQRKQRERDNLAVAVSRLQFEVWAVACEDHELGGELRQLVRKIDAKVKQLDKDIEFESFIEKRYNGRV